MFRRTLQSKPTQTLQLLNDAISECDLNEDSDFCEYFEDGDGEDIVIEPDDEEEEDEVEEKPRPRFAGESDHCYYMEKTSFTRIDNLGIDTPSDSGK